jgi:hypothetical protein
VKVVTFTSCLAVVNYQEGWVVTVYEDGTTVRSQSFDDEVAAEFGYNPPDGKRLSCDHDLLHLWLGERLGGGSLNHWILAHDGDKDISRKCREREERLVTGVMMLMRAERVPQETSWTTVPNESRHYMAFAAELLGSEVMNIAQEGAEFLRTHFDVNG